jgi:predicted chitinase
MRGLGWAAAFVAALTVAAAIPVRARQKRKAMQREVTVDTLRSIMPNLPRTRATQLLPHLVAAMAEYEVNTLARKAAFLAQLALESGELRYMEEIASGEAYEGRKSLGNTQPGDGKRFKGRGPIQITGRANYTDAGRALGLNLVDNPERAADFDVGFRVAGWFWQSRGLNALADLGTLAAFRSITHRINGGYNGLAEREAYWARAKAALGGVA